MCVFEYPPQENNEKPRCHDERRRNQHLLLVSYQSRVDIMWRGLLISGSNPLATLVFLGEKQACALNRQADEKGKLASAN